MSKWWKEKKDKRNTQCNNDPPPKFKARETHTVEVMILGASEEQTCGKCERIHQSV